ncbi:MAG: hypothetical protein BWZ00_01688 [Bacteroidetes bacterium ADurb.BinA174]|nr:MAG: hypothetical protein BWZ00_01688 [Bacteroidetes bacterium ADurb.BinA174]
MATKTRNTVKVKIQTMAVVEGNKPCVQTEHLMCQLGHQHAFITAYLKGNGYVKLFSLRNFIEWEFYDRPARSVDITQDEYNDDTVFERIIERNFISLSNK